jgi:hypothetical protein
MTILVLAAMSEAEFGGWEGALREAFPGEELRIYPDLGDPAAIEIALVANPPSGSWVNYRTSGSSIASGAASMRSSAIRLCRATCPWCGWSMRRWPAR